MRNCHSVLIDSRPFEVHVFSDRVVFFFQESQSDEKLEKLKKICQTIDEDIISYVIYYISPSLKEDFKIEPQKLWDDTNFHITERN